MKKIFSILLAAGLSMSLIGCGAQNKQQEEAPEKAQTLTIGVMGSVDAVPMIIAAEKGYFEQEGVDVKVEVFKAAKDRDAALQAGELDGVLADEVAISLYQNAGIDMKITGSTDGQFGLVAGADTGISSVADLVGKKIAISENTMIEFMLDNILRAQGIDIEAVEKVAIPPMPTRLEMLNNKEVDAALMPNPFSDAAIAAGGHVIETVDSTGMYISITAFLQDAIDTKSEEIKAFYRAYNEAVKYLNQTDISEYEETIINVVGYPETMKGKITLPVFRANVLPPLEQIDEVLTWSRNKGIITGDFTAKDLVSEIGIQ